MLKSVLLGEVLKVLFNLTVDPKSEDGGELEQVAATLNRLLRLTTATRELQTKAMSDIITWKTIQMSEHARRNCMR